MRRGAVFMVGTCEEPLRCAMRGRTDVSIVKMRRSAVNKSRRAGGRVYACAGAS